MQRIPEELPVSRTGGVLPPPAHTPVERRSSQAVGPLFARKESTTTPPLPTATVLTGQEPVLDILRRLNIDTGFSASYEHLYREVRALADDPLAQFEAREQSKRIIRQLLSSRTQVADALIQALPTEAHHVSFGNISVYFNGTTAHVFGAPTGRPGQAVVQQLLSKGVTHPAQAQILQRHLGASAIQARTLQQSQASQKKAQAAAHGFGVELRVAAIELHLEEPAAVEKAEAQPKAMLEAAPPVGAQAKAQPVEERAPSEKPSVGTGRRERIEKEAAEKKKEKAQTEESHVSRIKKQRMKKQKIAQGERRGGETQKEQLKQV
jgi:hypothetical protein